MLGLKDLIFLIVGTVIGSGIFLVPGIVLRNLRENVALALLVWLGGGVLSLLGALTYGELSALDPKAGGLYVYIRRAFGPFPAFLYGWTLFLVIASGSVATLAVAFSTYLGQIVVMSSATARAVAILMIVIVTVVNVRGTRQSATLQNWSTGIKVLALVALGTLLLWLGHAWKGGAADPPAARALSFPPVSSFGVAMISVLWAYEGWQYCTFSSGETVDPQRNFPRAFLYGTIALILIYVFTNLGYLNALGPARAAQSDRIAATATAVVLGPWASKIVTATILVSIFSAANGLTLTGTRVYYAMANDGVFIRKLGEVHPRFGTPAFAVLASSLWAAALAASGTFEQLLTYVVFSGWIFYALGAASLFVYRRNFRAQPSAYRVPGYPWTPVLFILAAAALVGDTIVVQPERAAVGMIVVLTGAPAYLIWAWRRKKGDASPSA